ncbi:MAG: RnfABCDGE type electron transport complex subunit [Desulfacinum sp.]|jgi:electron transport complex protein RnfD|nr:RnfABCDGE type electron transport complex subunit [Desulfacinum sp.]
MTRPDLIVSVSPHIHSGKSVDAMMRDWLVALVPCILAGWFFFGFAALQVVIISALTAVAVEAAWQKALGRPLTVSDGSAALTGVILGLLLSPEVPWWIPVLGAIVAILIGKQLFGGLGNHPFNSALVGYTFLFISYQHLLESFPMPQPAFLLEPGGFIEYPPMDVLKMDGVEVVRDIPWMDLFLGNVPGTAGTVSVLAVLLGGLYLVARGTIRWQIPLFCLLGTFVFAAICKVVSPQNYAAPLFYVLAGWTCFSAFFLATEVGTCPVTLPGMILYGLGCGCLLMTIRIWGTYMEGAAFAILLMNSLTPLLDRIRPKVVGRVEQIA